MAAIAPAEVRALSGLIDELDYYQLLEIPGDAPSSVVKRAYYQATRRLHPDHNRHLGGDDRVALERIARRVAEAYQVLRHAGRRKAYDEQIASAGKANRIQLVQAEAKAGKDAREAQMGKDAQRPPLPSGSHAATSSARISRRPSGTSRWR